MLSGKGVKLHCGHPGSQCLGVMMQKGISPSSGGQKEKASISASCVFAKSFQST